MSKVLERFSPSQSNLDFVKKSVLIKSEVWAWINVTLYRLLPRQFRGWRRFWLLCFGARMAPTVSFGRLARIDRPWNLRIGHLSSIGDEAWIYCLDKIIIGDKVCIGPGVKLLTGSHDISAPCFDLVTKPIRIESGAWVANFSTVLPGVTIGEGAVIGACSVVTKNVEPWTVVAGNPARFIKRRAIRE